METQRRSILKKLFASAVGVTGLSLFAKGETTGTSSGKEVRNVTMGSSAPLFSGATTHGDLIFVAGKGAHVEPFEIKAHTEIVLKDLEKELIAAGSSMQKVLKVNVYLADLNDYKAMNEVYQGKFGDNPPVRTTVSTYGGVPGNSLVEIDCIAYK